MKPSDIRKANREKCEVILRRADKDYLGLQDENLPVGSLRETPFEVIGALVAAYTRIEALVDACTTVKAFLDKLEDCDKDDPLWAIRRKFHAPLHAKLDAALAAVRVQP